MALRSTWGCGCVTKGNQRRHPWPTDGITKRQLDRQTDRLDKRIDLYREKIQSLTQRVAVLEDRVLIFLHHLGEK